MALNITFVAGDKLDESLFVAVDPDVKEDNKRAARATHVIPETLQKLASANKLVVEPEYFIAELTKLCKTLDDFERVVASLAVGDQRLAVKAAKEDAPVLSMEPTKAPKTEDKPVVAMETQLTEAPSGKGGDKAVSQFYGRLPGAKAGGPEQAIDVNSAAKQDAVIQALAEEIKKKDEEIAGLKGKIETKEKEDDLGEIKSLLGQAKVDPKEMDKILADLAKVKDEVALGVIEKVLRLVCKPAAKSPTPPPPPSSAPKGAPGGMPEGLLPKASEEDLRATASNITTIAEPIGESTSLLSTRWGELDIVTKER